MRLSNNWWLLGWLFAFGGFTLIFSPQQEELVLGKRCARWHWLYAVILAAPYVVWAGWRGLSYGDTAMYQMTFNEMPVGMSHFGEYMGQVVKDRGFVIFEYGFKTFVSQRPEIFFLTVAAIQMICLVRIYRKYSVSFWLSMFFFVASTDYTAWMHNGMRQFLAAAIIFTCIPLIIKKKYLSMAIIVLLASQIHLSAIVFLPILLIVNGRAWNTRSILFIITVILSFFFLDRITGFMTEAMEDTVYEGDIQTLLTDDGTNIIRVAFYSVPALMALIFRGYIDAADDPMINMCANLSVVAMGFYIFSFFTSGILIGRIPIYFSLANYILIPWLINEVFDPSSAMLVDTVFVGTYSYFFYYQMSVNWHIL